MVDLPLKPLRQITKINQKHLGLRRTARFPSRANIEAFALFRRVANTQPLQVPDAPSGFQVRRLCWTPVCGVRARASSLCPARPEP